MRLLALLLCVAAAPLAAQTDWLPVPEDTPARSDLRPAVGEWHVAGDIGFANFIPGFFRERGTRFALVLERQVHRAVAVQADVNCSRGSKARIPNVPQEFVSLCAGVVNAVVPLQLRPRLWPYAKLGYGVALWDEQSREGFYNVDYAAPTWVIGGGFRSYLDAEQRLGLRLDVQRQQTTLRDLKVPHWSFGLGLSMRVPRS